MLKRKLAITKLTIIAIMSALYVVFSLISIKLGDNIKITFSGLATIISAIYLGPVSGMITGFVGGFIEQMLNYGFSATTILWITPPAVRGLTMGLIFIAFKKQFKFISLTVGIISSSLIVTALNTLFIYIDSIIYNYYTYEYVFGATAFRFVSSALTAVAMIIIIVPVTVALNKQNLLPKLLTNNSVK